MAGWAIFVFEETQSWSLRASADDVQGTNAVQRSQSPWIRRPEVKILGHNKFEEFNALRISGIFIEDHL